MRETRCAAAGARNRLPMKREDVLGGGVGREPRGAAVGARVNGCPWDEETCTMAARGGHLDVLKWAIHNLCPLNWQACMSIATENDHPDVLAWLNENKTRSH